MLPCHVTGKLLKQIELNWKQLMMYMSLALPVLYVCNALHEEENSRKGNVCARCDIL